MTFRNIKTELLVRQCVEPFSTILRAAPHRDIGRLSMTQLLQSYLTTLSRCRSGATSASPQSSITSSSPTLTATSTLTQELIQESRSFINEWALRSVFSKKWNDVGLLPISGGRQGGEEEREQGTKEEAAHAGARRGVVDDEVAVEADFSRACFAAGHRTAAPWWSSPQGSSSSTTPLQPLPESWQLLSSSFFLAPHNGKLDSNANAQLQRLLHAVESASALYGGSNEAISNEAQLPKRIHHVRVVIPFSTLWELRHRAFTTTSTSPDRRNQQQGTNATSTSLRQADSQLLVSTLSLIEQLLWTQWQSKVFQRDGGIPVLHIRAEGAGGQQGAARACSVAVEVAPLTAEIDTFVRHVTTTSSPSPSSQDGSRGGVVNPLQSITPVMWCEDALVRHALFANFAVPSSPAHVVAQGKGVRQRVEDLYQGRLARDCRLTEVLGPMPTDPHKKIVRGCGDLAKKLESREGNMRLCAKISRA